MRGKNLGGTYAVWVDGRELKAHGDQVDEIQLMEYDPLRLGDPNQPDFRVADLNLPKSISVERIEERRSFLKVWDTLYRQKEEIANSIGDEQGVPISGLV